jgi:hypothetical protein
LIEPARRRRVQHFETEPTLALLYSTADTRRQWVNTGQALERTLLTATVRGVATTLMTQPMEIHHLRQLLVDSAASLVPQAIVRFGYGPPSAPTPRRPLEEIVDGRRDGSARAVSVRTVTDSAHEPAPKSLFDEAISAATMYGGRALARATHHRTALRSRWRQGFLG